MSFLNAMLLSGAVACVAPLLIHLLNRSHLPTVSWGAMHFLDAALDSSSRRVHWESWLLLLVRCLIPILLAVALARPVLTQLRSSAVEGQSSVTMLLDNSLSMAATENGTTLLQRAANELAKLAEASQSDQWSVWTTATPATDLLAGPGSSLVRVRAALQQVGQPAGTSPPVASLQLGLHQSAAFGQSSRQVILASDFQAAHWRAIGDNELQGLRNQLDSSGSPTQLFLLPVRTTDPVPNLSIHFDETASRARPDQAYHIAAQVTNHSPATLDAVRVTFAVDGQDMTSRNLQLSPGASERVPFACEFSDLGRHQVAARVQDPGDVHGDDASVHEFDVAPPPRILIIDDSLQPLQVSAAAANVDPAAHASLSGSSRFVQLALSPFADPAQNPFHVDRGRSDQLTRAFLNRYDAAIVTELENYSSAVLDELSAYVRTGGGLLVFPNEISETRTVEAVKYPTHELLPMYFAHVRTAAETRPAKLMIADSSASAASPFQHVFDGLQAFAFTRWWQLQPADSSAQVRVLAEFRDGEPWLVEQKLGDGVVLQCASSCSDVGTNFPSQPEFVPIILSLAEWMIDRTDNKLQSPSGGAYAANWNQPPSESQLGSLNDAEMQSLAAQLGATLLDAGAPADAYQRAEQLRLQGREIWRWLLAGVLGLLFAELFLGMRGASSGSRGM